MMTVAGLGYTQQDTLVEVMEVPLNVARVAATQHELNNIRKLYLLDHISGAVPRDIETNFDGYVRSHFHSDERDTALDFWLNPYSIYIDDEEVIFWSYGPDGEDDTEDDIWITLPVD
jgi:hypothetical protein